MRSLARRNRVRSQVDYLFDRRHVEAQQCVQLSRTNDRRLLVWCREPCSLSDRNVSSLSIRKQKSLGDWSDGGTPGYITNPVVKPVSADGTWSADSWESRSLPRDFLCLNQRRIFFETPGVVQNFPRRLPCRACWYNYPIQTRVGGLRCSFSWPWH